MRIDAHQHFWRIDRGDDGWITEAPAPIRRDVLPPDLAPLLAAHDIDGTILVQAAPSPAETRFLLSLARDHAFILGVVGWVDLAHPDAATTLADLARDPVCKGVRPMLRDIADSNWILRPEVLDTLDAMAGTGLRLHVLVTPRHLPALAELARDRPDLPIVIDHGAKPLIGGTSEPGHGWRAQMRTLASHPQVMCKLSGLVTEAGPDWTVERLRPTVDHLLHCFGADRLMWGSDWPVLELAGSYGRWVAATETLLAGRTSAERAAIFGETARRFYGLSGEGPDDRGPQATGSSRTR